MNKELEKILEQYLRTIGKFTFSEKTREDDYNKFLIAGMLLTQDIHRVTGKDLTLGSTIEKHGRFADHQVENLVNILNKA